MTVRYPDFAEPVVVSHPAHGMFVSLVPGQVFDDDDPLVAAFPHFFVAGDAVQERPAPVESVAIEAATAAPVESVAIEAATAAPGEKRTRTRTRRGQ